MVQGHVEVTRHEAIGRGIQTKYLMIKCCLILDYFHGHILVSIFPDASNHLPERALAQDVSHYVPDRTMPLCLYSNIYKQSFIRMSPQKLTGYQSSYICKQDGNLPGPKVIFFAPSGVGHQDIVHIDDQIIEFIVVAIIACPHTGDSQATPAGWDLVLSETCGVHQARLDRFIPKLHKPENSD